MSPSRKTQPDILLLLIATIALIGVVFITAHQTYSNGHGLDVHFQENTYGIVVAAFVTALCVLEMVGCNWDRGLLDLVLDGWNSRGKEKTQEVLKEKEVFS